MNVSVNDPGIESKVNKTCAKWTSANFESLNFCIFTAFIYLSALYLPMKPNFENLILDSVGR